MALGQQMELGPIHQQIKKNGIKSIFEMKPNAPKLLPAISRTPIITQSPHLSPEQNPCLKPRHSPNVSRNRAIERTNERLEREISPEAQRESQFLIGVINRKYDLAKPFPFYQDEPLHVALRRNSEAKSPSSIQLSPSRKAPLTIQSKELPVMQSKAVTGNRKLSVPSAFLSPLSSRQKPINIFKPQNINLMRNRSSHSPTPAEIKTTESMRTLDTELNGQKYALRAKYLQHFEDERLAPQSLMSPRQPNLEELHKIMIKENDSRHLQQTNHQYNDAALERDSIGQRQYTVGSEDREATGYRESNIGTAHLNTAFGKKKHRPINADIAVYSRDSGFGEMAQNVQTAVDPEQLLLATNGLAMVGTPGGGPGTYHPKAQEISTQVDIEVYMQNVYPNLQKVAIRFEDSIMRQTGPPTKYNPRPKVPKFITAMQQKKPLRQKMLILENPSKLQEDSNRGKSPRLNSPNADLEGAYDMNGKNISNSNSRIALNSPFQQRPQKANINKAQVQKFKGAMFEGLGIERASAMQNNHHQSIGVGSFNANTSMQMSDKHFRSSVRRVSHLQDAKYSQIHNIQVPSVHEDKSGDNAYQDQVSGSRPVSSAYEGPRDQKTNSPGQIKAILRVKKDNIGVAAQDIIDDENFQNYLGQKTIFADQNSNFKRTIANNIMPQKYSPLKHHRITGIAHYDKERQKVSKSKLVKSPKIFGATGNADLGDQFLSPKFSLGMGQQLSELDFVSRPGEDVATDMNSPDGNGIDMQFDNRNIDTSILGTKDKPNSPHQEFA